VADDLRQKLIDALEEAQSRPHASVPVPDGLYPNEIAAVAWWVFDGRCPHCCEGAA
jgi:hypothetical protein